MYHRRWMACIASRARGYTWSTAAGRLRRIYGDLTARTLVDIAEGDRHAIDATLVVETLDNDLRCIACGHTKDGGGAGEESGDADIEAVRLVLRHGARRQHGKRGRHQKLLSHVTSHSLLLQLLLLCWALSPPRLPNFFTYWHERGARQNVSYRAPSHSADRDRVDDHLHGAAQTRLAEHEEEFPGLVGHKFAGLHVLEDVDAVLRQQDLVAFPFIAGPGSLTTILLAFGPASGDPVLFGGLLACVAVALLVVLVTLYAVGPIYRVMGVTGANVMNRLFGVLLGALAIQYVLDGLRGSLVDVAGAPPG